MNKFIRHTLKVLASPALFINREIKKTNWYNNKYGDILKFRHDIFNLDVVNLGSNPAKYALDYSDEPVKAANWATGPQSLSYDFRILKNYHSFIHKNGFVLLLLLCPFSGFVIDYKEPIQHVKYHCFLHPILVQNFQERTYKKIQREVQYPLFAYPLHSLKALVFDSQDMMAYDTNPMNESELKTDAQRWIDGWKNEFSITSFDDALSVENRKAISYNSELLYEMACFCKARNLRPVVITAPVTRYLSDLIPDDFVQTAFYNMLDKVKEIVPVMDYYKNKRFQDASLYFNSFFLNLQGRKLFTHQVLQDVGLI